MCDFDSHKSLIDRLDDEDAIPYGDGMEISIDNEKSVQKVSWVKVESCVERIYQQVKCYDYQMIYGVPRGGLIPAVMLSHRLGLPLIDYFTDQYNVLIVEDVVDSGGTIIRDGYPVDQVATIFKNTENCKVNPKFVGAETKVWVKFPWEMEVNDKISNKVL